jgi:mono/diheme cytochrome c family protein
VAFGLRWLVAVTLLGISIGSSVTRAESSGQELYDKKCKLCHSIKGEGGKQAEKGGPLDGVGAKRDRAWLEKYLQDPKSMLPDVSDDQTLEFLREQGVGYAQGYRIGRPRPIDEVLNMDMQGTEARQPPKRVQRPALGTGDEAEGESDAEQDEAESTA